MADIVTDLGVDKNWKAFRNGHNTFTITLVDSNGAAVSTANHVFTVNFRTPGGDTNKLQLTEGSGITNGGATGIITIVLSQANITASLPRDMYYWEVSYVVNSQTYRLYEGYTTLNAESNPGTATTSVSQTVSLAGVNNVTATVTLVGAVTAASIATALGAQTATHFYGGPTPSFRALADADIPAAIARLASPTFTGTPLAPTAAVGTDTTQIATSAYVQANALVTKVSTTYPDGRAYSAAPLLTLGNGAGNLEFINVGNPGFVPQGTETRNLVPVGLVRLGGNLNIVRNVAFDAVNLRWYTPYLQSDAYGGGLLEMGGEGINTHVCPAGSEFYNVNTMTFSFRQDGARGVPGYTTGQVNQSMVPLFIHYASASYQSGKLRSWNPTTATEPLIHLHADELKGTAGTFNQNELLKLEVNSNTATAFPAFNFYNSGGSYSSRAATATNKTVAALGSVIHDGTTDQLTAQIIFTSRGTISSGVAQQSIKMAVSPSNTAGLLTRTELFHDVYKIYNIPTRSDYTSTISTIPDYSGNGYSPALSTSTVMQQQALSTTGGGWIMQGFSVSGTASASAFMFRGVQGHTSPTGANTIFQALKHNGTTNFASLADSEIAFHFRNNATTLIEVLGSGNVGFGVPTPTAKVQIRSTANNATALLVEDDGGNDIISAGESGGARVIGFFGVTPAIRQVVATGSTADQIITGLQNLGLFSQT